YVASVVQPMSHDVPSVVDDRRADQRIVVEHGEVEGHRARDRPSVKDVQQAPQPHSVAEVEVRVLPAVRVRRSRPGVGGSRYREVLVVLDVWHHPYGYTCTAGPGAGPPLKGPSIGKPVVDRVEWSTV